MGKAGFLCNRGTGRECEGEKSSKGQGCAAGLGQAARTRALREKNIQPPKGPQSSCLGPHHSSKRLNPSFVPQLYFYCNLERNWNYFLFFMRFLSLWTSPRKGGWMWVPVTRYAAPTVISAPRKHKEAKEGRHWSPEDADVYPLRSKPGGSVPRTTFWKHLPDICGMPLCAGCWAERVSKTVVLVLQEPT